MNILVTGGCGFIGSNFSNYILQKYPQYNIINIDIMYYCASEDNVKANNNSNYKFIKCDINDTNFVKYILNKEKITHIVHFAAQSHVDNSFDNSLQYTTDNIRGTHSLLEAVRLTNLDIKFLHFQQMKCMENQR